MTILVIDKKIDEDSAQYCWLINQAEVIINFSRYSFASPKLLDCSQEYNELRNEIRKDYLKFIAEFGEICINGKTIKELFLIKNGCSLWWFNEIVHKDSFNDSFIDDLCKATIIKRLSRRLNNGVRILLHTDSVILNVLAGKANVGLSRFICSSCLARLYHLFHFCRVKLRLLLLGVRDCAEEKNKATLFLSHYPQNWTYDSAGKLTDRFYRDLPENLAPYGYIVNVFPGVACGKQSIKRIGNAYFIQNNVGWLTIFGRFFSLKNVIKYLWCRKLIMKQMVFNGLDVSPLLDRYMLETMIVNDFSFWLQIKGADNIIRKVQPGRLISADEFGPYSRAIIVSAHKSDVEVAWLQHAVLSKWRMWFFNMPEEISDPGGGINSNFIARMPVADRFFVWGKKTLQLISDIGYPVDRMFIVGNPRYDLYQHKKTNDKSLNTSLLVLTPSVDSEEIDYFLGLATDLKCAFPNKSIVVKMHPRYLEVLDNEMRSKIHSLSLNGVAIKTDNIDNYYNSSNILISGVSTVGIEAAYFGTKVITMLCRYNDRFTPDWIEEGSVAYSSAELIDRIKCIEQVKTLDWSDYYEIPGKSLRTLVGILNGIHDCHKTQQEARLSL